MSLVPGAVNFRDIGGLPAGGSRTRSGVLYRSGNLAGVDEVGGVAFRELGVRRVIDLRSDDEVAHAPSRVGDVETLRVPLFLGSVTSFFVEDISLAQMYRALLERSGDRLVTAIRGILGAEPVVIHCTVGKDRTGITVALALAAAGVDEDAVVADYALTEQNLPAWRGDRMLARIREAYPDAKHLEELATKSPAPVMRDVLAQVRAEHGSAGDYLREHGMTDDELAQLRRTLIEA
ncbi:tyrosine-protein phosphatase [Microbacterium paludicola]|uniref:Tyrosine-protein phosphatase n=1 Tax=Microbacterium paludicola TaxID=300019 RepID=A0A4Y9FUQ9_9MICO|nr:tyrosine-protein phosphatase [Microbacterium paludicola]MBF0816307.1 tyrosine-protein phosphatase [Microbacterium paludicola]TFU32973.1 tyrosine-protein phosphatase [Microbacterium paludicola]